MNKRLLGVLKGITGFVWLSIFAACGIVLFMSNEVWAEKILINNNVGIISKYTGGDINYEKEENGHLLVVHKPVKDGIFLKSKDSFIQIDWLSMGNLPVKLGEAIDLDKDGHEDLQVDMDTKNNTVTYNAYTADIKGLAIRSSVLDYIFKRSEDGRDALFYFRDRKYGGIEYKEGVSVRFVIRQK